MESKKGNVFSSAGVVSFLLNKALNQGCNAIEVEPLKMHDLRHAFSCLAKIASTDFRDL